jgi:hypothetical protein
MTIPLHQQLTNRAVQLMGDDISFEHAISRARGEFELASNKALHEAVCFALDLWKKAQQQPEFEAARKTLIAVGDELRGEL